MSKNFYELLHFILGQYVKHNQLDEPFGLTQTFGLHNITQDNGLDLLQMGVYSQRTCKITFLYFCFKWYFQQFVFPIN